MQIRRSNLKNLLVSFRQLLMLQRRKGLQIQWLLYSLQLAQQQTRQWTNLCSCLRSLASTLDPLYSKASTRPSALRVSTYTQETLRLDYMQIIKMLECYCKQQVSMCLLQSRIQRTPTSIVITVTITFLFISSKTSAPSICIMQLQVLCI